MMTARFSKQLNAALATSYWPFLDGLRAVAVLLVMLYHFGFARINGAIGVEIFFVLSGFLITWLLLREDDKYGDISIRGFYARRVLRILPAFYAYWLFAVALLWLRNHPIPWPHAWSAFFYFSDYYNALVRPPSSFVSHTWSLAIEEQYYLIWPVVFWCFRRHLARFRDVLAGTIVGIWIYRALLHAVFHVHEAYIYNAFDTRLDNLLIGCLLAILLKTGAWSPLWERVSRRGVYVVVLLLLLGASASLDLISIGFRNVVGFALEPVLIAGLLVQSMILEGSFFRRVLDSQRMRYLGRISYSLYLYHGVTLFAWHRFLTSHGILMQLLVGMGTTIALASGSYFFIEQPFLRLKAKMRMPRTTEKPWPLLETKTLPSWQRT